MKKLMVTSTIVLVAALTLVLAAGVLRSITFSGDFSPATLATAFITLGYLAAAISGVILAGCAAVHVARGGDAKKALVISAIITAVGVALVLIAAVFGSISWSGGFNPGLVSGTALSAIMNTIGYLAATLAGVVLTVMAVANVARKETSK